VRRTLDGPEREPGRAGKTSEHRETGERRQRSRDMATTTTSTPTDSTNPTSLPTDAISYDDLYARWERGNWCATELDFT
jgi:hypothetical protein